MLYLLGQPAVHRISGKVYQETGMDPGRRASSGYDVEELGVGFVKLASGMTLDLIEAWAIHLDGFEGSSIVGSKGGIRPNVSPMRGTDAFLGRARGGSPWRPRH